MAARVPMSKRKKWSLIASLFIIGAIAWTLLLTGNAGAATLATHGYVDSADMASVSVALKSPDARDKVALVKITVTNKTDAILPTMIIGLPMDGRETKMWGASNFHIDRAKAGPGIVRIWVVKGLKPHHSTTLVYPIMVTLVGGALHFHIGWSFAPADDWTEIERVWMIS